LKSGHAVKTIEALPNVKVGFVTAQELLATLEGAQDHQKGAEGSGTTQVTLLDLRTELHLTDDYTKNNLIPIIKFSGKTVFCLLDQLQRPDIRSQIPKQGLVVTITETGNRDQFAIQYLSKFGFTNIKGLMFGMRAWIKEGYPVESIPARGGR
jgi:rhodanese-related sulfurtransferase